MDSLLRAFTCTMLLSTALSLLRTARMLHKEGIGLNRVSWIALILVAALIAPIAFL